MTTLDWKIAAITGATSGPALAAAKLFVTEGAHVYITDRRKARLDAAIDDIGGKAIGIAGDASNLRDLDTVEEPLTVVTKESFDAAFGVNVRGSWAVSTKGVPGQSVYAASVAAVRALERRREPDQLREDADNEPIDK